MPLNISGSIVNSTIADTLDTEGIVKTGLKLYLDSDSVGSYPGNDTTYDLSGNSNDGTMYNGTGLTFDGSDDWIEHTQITHPTACTLMVWIKTSTGSKTICSHSSGGPVSTNYSISAAGYLRFHYYDGQWRDVDSNPITVTDGNWHHVVFARNGTNHKMYKDGELIDENTLTSQMGGAVNAIGRNWGGAYFNGLMSDFRIYSTQLSAAQISEIYRNPNTVLPTGVSASSLFRWWPLSEGSGTKAYDGSGNENHGTLTNGPTWTGGQTDIPQLAGKGHSRKMWFDGSNDYVNLGTSSTLVTPGDQVSVSVWVFCHPDALVNTNVITAGTNQTTSPYDIKFNNLAHPTWTIDTSEGDMGTGEAWSISSYEWVHLVGTYDGSNIKIYSNAVLKNTTAKTGTPIHDGSTPLTVGCNSGGGAGFFEGFIDEVAIWNSALDADAVTAIYDSGVPIDVRNNSSNYDEYTDKLIGYWRNDGPGRWLDLSGNGNHGTVNGSPSTVAFPKGTTSERDSQGFPSKISSFGFDGSSSYITLPSLDVTGSRTISMWFYTNVKGTGFLFQGGDGTDQFSISLSQSNGSSTSLVRAQASDSSSGYGTYAKDTSDGSIETGKWYNITATKTTGVVQNMYLNGVNDTSAGSNWHFTPDVSYIIGKRNEGSGNWVNGKITTFTLYNRVLQASEILHNFNVQRDRYGV
jgi:hypothetical protein